MVKAEQTFLEPELMDVVRLFPGAENLNFEVRVRQTDSLFQIEFDTEGRKLKFCHELPQEEKKSAIKRYSKLDLYEILSDRFQKDLPWGSLTGIRPTRLAYGELEKGRDFQNLFETLRVGKENIELVRRVIEGQRGIYERREGNVDLYVSVPFCPSKCDYCSFITAPIAKTRQYLSSYLEAVGKELKAAKPMIKNLRSVYIGGGTPFALETDELRQIFEWIAPLRQNGCEYTVEAGRPDVFTREKLDLCKQFGVTRICINAQSFSDQTLLAIGRKHTRAQLYEAFAMAQDYPFTINCDLIAGLTGENLAEFQKSVEEAIALFPENLTIHTLCLKKGAKLKEEHLPDRGHTNVMPLSEDGLSEMISYSRSALTAAGYEPYYLYRQKYMAGAHENVGWTRKGYASVYNIDVMEEISDNIAIGANAVSKKIFFGENRIMRLGSPKDLPTYLSKVDKIIDEKNLLFLR